MLSFSLPTAFCNLRTQLPRALNDDLSIPYCDALAKYMEKIRFLLSPEQRLGLTLGTHGESAKARFGVVQIGVVQIGVVQILKDLDRLREQGLTVLFRG